MICYVLAMGKQHLGPHVVVGYGINFLWPGLFITSPDHLAGASGEMKKNAGNPISKRKYRPIPQQETAFGGPYNETPFLKSYCYIRPRFNNCVGNL